MLRFLTSSGEGRAETELVSREYAFDVGAMTVLSLGKSGFHQAALGSFRPSPTVVARVQGNDRAANAQFAATEGVVVFGVIPFVGQQLRQAKISGSLSNDLGEPRRILTRTSTDGDSGDQVRVDVEPGGWLRPSGLNRVARRVQRTKWADA